LIPLATASLSFHMLYLDSLRLSASAYMESIPFFSIYS
jgi:hypothetical protein